MKAPAFWFGPPGPFATLLAPLAGVWQAVGRWQRRSVLPYRASVPVICVGNLLAGGTGKTPIAIDLLERLREAGLVAHGLSRGYGGRLEGPVLVELEAHGAREVGDEPLLLAGSAPTWIARDRVAGARAAVNAGAEIIVLDDGFQNPALAKSLSLLVVDGAVGFGNGRVIPAGPLREPVADGLDRAHAVVLLGEDRQGVGALIGDRLPVLQAVLEPEPASAAALSGRRVLAFAGIGRPGKFFDTLRACGATLTEAVPFPDHHAYTRGQMDDLLARAAAAGAVPVTTAKDAVRLTPEMRGRVCVLPIRVVWRNPSAVDTLLDRCLAANSRTHG